MQVLSFLFLVKNYLICGQRNQIPSLKSCVMFTCLAKILNENCWRCQQLTLRPMRHLQIARFAPDIRWTFLLGSLRPALAFGSLHVSRTKRRNWKFKRLTKKIKNKKNSSGVSEASLNDLFKRKLSN